MLHLAGALFVFIFLVYIFPSGSKKSSDKKKGKNNCKRNLRDRDFDANEEKKDEFDGKLDFLKDDPNIRDFKHKKVDDRYKTLVSPGPKVTVPDLDELDAVFTQMTNSGGVEGRRHLVTNYEHQYLEKLRLWFGETHRVYCQVAVGSAVKINPHVTDLPPVKRLKFAQKSHNMSFDFMLVERKTDRITCAIELDDSTHKTPDRMQRDTRLDKICKAAGLPIFHITDINQKPDLSKIKRGFLSSFK